MACTGRALGLLVDSGSKGVSVSCWVPAGSVVIIMMWLQRAPGTVELYHYYNGAAGLFDYLYCK